jgi:MFS family permease
MYTIVLIPGIGLAIGMLFGQQENEYARYAIRWHFFITVLFPIFAFLFGLLLLKWGDTIAARLIREDIRIEFTLTDDWERRIFSISMKIIGLIWLIRGIPDLIKATVELVSRWAYFYFSIPHMIGVALGASLSLIIGVYLLLDGRYFLKLAFGRKPDKTE